VYKVSFFIVSTVTAFLFYLVLSAGSGTELVFWSVQEAAMGAFLAIIVGLASSRIFSRLGVKPSLQFLNPVKWVYLIVFLVGPFFVALAKANIDVAIRVITGNIKPGIVKISPKMKTDLGTAMLANSITLTPGTLTVAEKNGDLYVHWINVEDKEPKIEQVCGSFPEWIRRITE